MLATPRRLLLALVALAASTPELIAAMTCTPNGANSWTCVSDDYPSYPPYDPTDPDSPYTKPVTNTIEISFSTNIEFRCDNCTAMTPSECSQLKSDILTIYNRIYDLSSQVDDKLDPFLDEDSLEERFVFPYWDILDSPDITYPDSWYSQGESNIDDLYSFFSELHSAAESVKSALDQITDQAANGRSFVNNINCSSCSAQNIPVDINFTTNVVVSAPSGGGGGSGGGGSSSSGGCCCKEELEAIFNILKNDFLPKVKRIDENVEKLKELIETAKKQLETTKTGFGNVTNLFNRLDDYVLDDFSNRVFQIRYDVNFIASNLAQKVQRIFIDQSYSNAQFYVRQDSDTPVEMADLDETLIPEGDMSKFDWGEFENLSWFTRVEYLLLKLNGVYVSTNDNSNAGIDEAKENQQEIEDSYSDFQTSINGDVKSGFTRVGTSISSFFSSFNSAVSTQGDKVVEIHLISNFIGQESLDLKIDPDVADACRTVSSLLWTVLFGFLLYKIFLFFWLIFVDTIQWWIRQTQEFLD